MEAQKENNKLILEKELLSPYVYFLQSKRKRRTISIMMTFNHWLQVPSEKVTIIRDLTEMLYDSSSMCDDIQDNSMVRGVMPAAHCVFGIPLTINSAVMVLLLVLEKASNLCPEACRVIVENYLATYRGQGTEIYWRDNFICPTEEQYRKMTELKSSKFFMIPVRLMQLFSENKTDFNKLGDILGTYFTVEDDYCNLNYQEVLEGWPEKGDKKVCNDSRFCEDITEGKFSLAMIHALKSADREQIWSIVRQRTRDVNLKKHCLGLLEKAGSLQYTRDALTELDRETRAEVARLGGNPEMEALLDKFLRWQK